MGEIIFCNECKWYKRGECNLYPPSVLDTGAGGDKYWLRPAVAPDDFCSMAEKKEVGCHISAPKLLIMLEKLYGYAAAAEISVSALDEALAVINEAKREKRL